MAKKSAKRATGTKASPKAVKRKSQAAKAGRGIHDDSPSPSPGVTIRMYCQGLGDCFLLTFRDGKKAEPTRVMIDCGVFLNTPGEPERMRAVAEDILDETKGEIDLLIVTHEHWDHIAGFSHANDIFEKKFKFGEVWLSWAENPDDADARAIKADLGKKKLKLKAALGAARAQLGLAGAAGTAGLAEDLDSSASVLDFLGPEGAAAARLGVAGSGSGLARGPRMDLGTTMDWLRAQVRSRDFCNPGERRAIPGTDGINAYILGPPRSAAMMRKMDPTGDQGYKLQADRVSLLGAVELLLKDEDATTAVPPGPFESADRIDPEGAAQDPFFRRHYGFPGDPLADPVAEWRRIDLDWLVGGLSRLALQLDAGVNNTSLALAFELPDGRTLIFPGDAQIGNWLSWGKLSFKVKDKAGRDVEVTAKDLLNRAVFYKVGHHGSHNATMKVGGLEEMTSGDLVAMIPTDQDYARTKRPPKTGWEMPAQGVYEALRGFTNGRIIRADHASVDQLDQDVETTVRGSRSWKEFLGRVKFDGKFPNDAQRADGPLFVEYTLSL
jgi:hypothetical protein